MGAEPSSTSSLSTRSRTDNKDNNAMQCIAIPQWPKRSIALHCIALHCNAEMTKEIQNTPIVGMDKKRRAKLIADVNVTPFSITAGNVGTFEQSCLTMWVAKLCLLLSYGNSDPEWYSVQRAEWKRLMGKKGTVFPEIIIFFPALPKLPLPHPSPQFRQLGLLFSGLMTE